jgi:thioredoxin reductase
METKIMTSEIAIIGGGPAGLAAAIEAAKSGAQVILIDENNQPGGQLFKQIHKFFGSRDHYAGIRGFDIGMQLLQECKELKVKTLLNTVAFGLFERDEIGLVFNNKSFILKAKKIILATGASENVLTFPGWTLPGVMGAGALQTMMNVHRVLPGKNILMIGSGNVGLIVSYQALQAGANVVAIIEAAPKIGGYGVHAAKIRRAGVPILTSYTVKEVLGDNQVRAAIITQVGKQWEPIKGTEKDLDIDTICLSVGLSPLAELAWMAGCRFVYMHDLGGFIPIHNCDMRTNLENIYVAGDITGIEEASTALEEGRLAGLSAAESLGYIKSEICIERKKEIQKRLYNLRSGPFGEIRKKLKEPLMKRKELIDYV